MTVKYKGVSKEEFFESQATDIQSCMEGDELIIEIEYQLGKKFSESILNHKGQYITITLDEIIEDCTEMTFYITEDGELRRIN